MDYKYIYLIGEELNSLNNTCTYNHCYIQVGLWTHKHAFFIVDFKFLTLA